jgi:hypothetical protein
VYVFLAKVVSDVLDQTLVLSHDYPSMKLRKLAASCSSSSSTVCMPSFKMQAQSDELKLEQALNCFRIYYISSVQINRLLIVT